MDILELKINKMKKVLTELSDKNSTAKAQEELLLKQLKEEFGVVNLEEGYELYDQIIEEKSDLEKRVANRTESLYDTLISEGLIDATQ